jgi:hypothetical protein
MENYAMTGQTGKRARVGVSGVPARRGGSFTGLPVTSPEPAAAPWRVRTPEVVDHNWTRVSVPDGRCRRAT